MRPLSLTPLRDRLLGVLGALPVLTSASCGALVVYVEDDGGGGAGGGPAATTAVTTGAVTASATSSTGCPMVEMAETVCVANPPSPCPPSASVAADDLVRAHLNATCDPGDPELCGCSVATLDVLCGPFPSAAGPCCYVASYGIDTICEGRAFTVGGRPRVAAPAERDDWLTGSSRCGVELDASVRRELADAWTRAGSHEHASIASFARVALELLSIGAPRELVDLALRAAADESAHASLSFGIAASLSGRPVGPGPLSADGAGARVGAAAIVRATVREGCLGETVSAVLALAARDGAEDPSVRAALERIAEDELRHAELAWRTVAWAVGAGLPGAAEAAAAAFEEPWPGLEEHGSPEHLSPDVARAFGVLLRDEKERLVTRALAEVVAPSRAAVLALCEALGEETRGERTGSVEDAPEDVEDAS